MTENTTFTQEQLVRVEALNDIFGQMQRFDTDGILPEGVSKQQLVDDTMHIYGPEAEQLGLTTLQYDMLNLAVKIGYPDDYRYLKQLLADSEAMCENVFKVFSLPITAMLDDLGIEFTFKYRMKSIYSIWRKMRIDHKQFDDVYDLFATRIIYKVPEGIPSGLNGPHIIDKLPEVQATRLEIMTESEIEKLYCWRIYNVLSMLYRIHPDRIKDWITHPKPSGYQALQMTLMGPDCNWIEIQIRSERMDYEAEYGVAAHWKYKAEKSVK